jgi:hypothetical protein
VSYDIWLTIDTGGPEPAQVGRDFNMTSNVAPMWRLAGADLAEFHGHYAGNTLHLLDKAIADMTENPGKYAPLNPPNRWGDYASCLAFLHGLRDEFAAHPRAKVQVSR